MIRESIFLKKKNRAGYYPKITLGRRLLGSLFDGEWFALVGSLLGWGRWTNIKIKGGNSLHLGRWDNRRCAN